MLPSSPNIKPKEQYQIANTVIEFLLHVKNITIEQITPSNRDEIYNIFLVANKRPKLPVL